MSPIAETSTGLVAGTERDGVRSFKGIPYGASTAREWRFRPARPPEPWSGVRECLDYGPSCPQITVEQMTGTAIPAEAVTYMGVLPSERSVSEDCLALNVWTPTEDREANLPVVVWLHGGGLSTGSASWPLYDFSNLARNRRVVAVGVNHRLGILGFLDLSHMGEEYAASGNVGILDVVDALAWVRGNIAAFGGDSGNVTVFGESGGGLKTSVLLAMPPALGLFHKAFVMSGAMLTVHAPDEARTRTDLVLDELGLTGIEDLKRVDIGALIDIEASLQTGSVLEIGSRRQFAPVLGPSLPRQPQDAIASGSAANIAVVSGCTTDEMLSFMMSDPELWTMDESGMRSRLRPVLGADLDTVVEGYRSIRVDDSPTSLLIAIASDATMRIPHIRLNEAKLSGGGEPVWSYLFAWGHPDPTGRIRAGHGSDMPYFFDNVDRAPIAAGTHAGPLTAAMSGALASLAHTGQPGHTAIPSWPSYNLDGRYTMQFGVSTTLETDPYGRERCCWDGIDLGLASDSSR
jgi:para-nitrobenzyl esterase